MPDMSIDNIDDYDLAEIALRDDGSADKIQMEGQTLHDLWMLPGRAKTRRRDGGWQ